MTVALGHTDVIDLDSWGVPNFDLQRQGYDVPPRSEWRIESRFRQTCVRNKTSTLFRQFNRHYLSVHTYRRRKEMPEKVIDLTFVEPQPREIREYHYKHWLVVACLLALPVAIQSLAPISLWWLVPPVCMAIVLAVVTFRGRQHRFDFVALNSDVVLFSVDATASGETRVAAFIEALCASTGIGQSQLPEGKDRIPLAVSEMRRLSEGGVITKEQYEEIKRNWFAL